MLDVGGARVIHRCSHVIRLQGLRKNEVSMSTEITAPGGQG
jgi:hypothetical protein